MTSADKIFSTQAWRSAEVTAKRSFEKDRRRNEADHHPQRQLGGEDEDPGHGPACAVRLKGWLVTSPPGRSREGHNTRSEARRLPPASRQSCRDRFSLGSSRDPR